MSPPRPAPPGKRAIVFSTQEDEGGDVNSAELILGLDQGNSNFATEPLIVPYRCAARLRKPGGK